MVKIHFTFIQIVVFSSVFYSCKPPKIQDSEVPFAIVLHGGAGTILRENMSEEKEQAISLILQNACDSGYEILKLGGSAMDAIEHTVRVLENSPFFNAGKGSVYNAEGIQEMDAAIMDGKTSLAGAVAGLRNIKNPISVARAVMTHSEHVLLTGVGAKAFAINLGMDTINASYFYDSIRYNQYLLQLEKEQKFGTVGAVALDKKGNLAAATSTGGMMMKKFGRVGDAPIIGAGTYANNATCAISATGHGEYFMRQVVAYDISALMEYRKLSLSTAAHLVVNHKLKKSGGAGGIIGIDGKGNVAMVFNTPGMYRAFKKSNDESGVFIFKD